MYVLVSIKGKQYKVEKGSLVKIDKLQKEKGEKVEFDSVMLISDEKDVKVGQPYIKGAKVKAIVQEHVRDKKVLVFKRKRRKGYRKKQGHRQDFTYIRVEEITC